MAERGYTLIDFAAPPELWKDWNRVVRFKEYVRANLESLVQGIPKGCEVDLFASGHPLNPGLLPLVGLWAPPELLDQVPDMMRMIDEIDDWCAGLSAEEVNAIIAKTNAPTWEELVRIGKYPAREYST